MRIAALAFGILAGIAASLLLAFGALDVPPGTGPADRGAQAIRFGLFLIGNAGIFGAALALWAPLGAAITLGIGALGWLAAILLTGRATDFVLYAPPALLILGAVLAVIAHLRRPRDEADVEILRPLRAPHAEPTSDADGFIYEDDHDDVEEDEREPEMEMPHFGTPPRNAAARESARAHEFFAADPDEEWDPRRKRSVPPRARADFREPDEEDEYEEEPSFFSRFALGTSGVLSFALYAAIAVVAVLVIWNWRTGASTQPSDAATEIAAVPAPVVAEPVVPVPAAPAPAAPALTPAPAAELPAPAAATSAAPALTPAPAPAETPEPAADAPAMRTIGAAPSTSTPAVTIVPETPPAPAETAAPAPASTSEPPPPTQAATVAAPGQPLPLLMPASMAALRQMPAPAPTDAPAPAPAATISLPAPVDTGL